MTTEPYTYFQPGELLFLLTQEGNTPINEQIRAFDDAMNTWIPFVDSQLKEHNARLTIYRRPDRELHFEGTRGDGSFPELRHDAFSLIPVAVRLPTDDRVEGAELADAMIYLDAMREALAGKLEGGRTNLHAVLLNWLAGPGSEYGGGGGPSGLPEPYVEIAGEEPPYKFVTTNVELSNHQGAGVTVAILDTAPNPHDMAAVYERYHKVRPQNRMETHPLIESLLRPHGPLHLHPASLDDLLRMRAVHLRDHNYEMSDHGLFVAGIVHTIAPLAEIHLYEVLNPQGVGDLLSIATGLRKVLTSLPGRPLLVNCSFILNIPLLNQPILDLDSQLLGLILKDSKEYPENGYLTNPGESGRDWLARQGRAIELICDQLRVQGAVVVASAGNDWVPNQKVPQARFPAAFSSVLGVGALPKKLQLDQNQKYLPASYSNFSDHPQGTGIVTLGGEAGAGNGVLGVYLGKFPLRESKLQKYPVPLRALLGIVWEFFAGPENKNNWAWWAGTSFAAPIVTGLAASVYCASGQPATSRVPDPLAQLNASKAVQSSLTARDEDAIIVVQQA